MHKMYLHIILLTAFFLTSNSSKAQMLANFETNETTPELSAEGICAVVNNPDINAINASEKVGYYNKIQGNWHYVSMLFPDSVNIANNNTLTFKLRASTVGRIFAKFWINNEILIESWAPNYEFKPAVNTWTECTMDLSPAMGKKFTKLELAACVDNNNVADVYFDDVKLSNPDIGNGSPKVSFIASRSKVQLSEEIAFDASSSFDLDGEIVAYEWDFGDGTNATGQKVVHTYHTDSVFNVQLTITDNDNKCSVAKRYVFVLNPDKKFSELAFTNPTYEVNNKIEAVFQLTEAYVNPYNPDEVKVDAEIQYPDGSKIVMPCFYHVQANLNNTTWLLDTSLQSWMLRFVSDQEGEHTLRILLKDNSGEFSSVQYRTMVSSGVSKGIIRNNEQNKQYYSHSSGQPFYPLGINLAWNTIDNYQTIINNLSKGQANVYRYWHTPFAEQALEWTANDFYSGLGFYSQKAAAMCDYLLNFSAIRNMYMQLVIFQHGMFSENVNEMWNDNPYNIANGGFVSKAEAYFYNPECKAQTKKLLRYIVARWAYSKNIFAWEFFNEVQFAGVYNSQTALWYPGVLSWHSEMSQYVQSIDPFNHIMTTSAEHNQIPDFDTISAIDNLQYHLYSDNLLSKQNNLDNQFLNQLTNASIINGEYGTNTEADVPFNTQRHAIWNGIMTQVPRFMWIWEHYLDINWANLFSMPAQYLSNENLASSILKTYNFEAEHEYMELSAIGMSNDTNFYGYISNTENSNSISGAKCKLKNIAFANYSVSYYLPYSNQVIKTDSLALIKLTNTLNLPDFIEGIAFKIKYQSDYNLPIAIAGNDTIVAPGISLSFSGEYSVNQVSGTTLNYRWQICEKPENSQLQLSNSSSKEITIVPDVSGLYKLSLTVNNGMDSSFPDTIQILASSKPVAIAGNDTVIDNSSRYFYLDGTNSYDPDGDSLTYLWTLIEWPQVSDGNLLKYNEPMAAIDVSSPGNYQVILTVNDGTSSSFPDTINVNVLATSIAENPNKLGLMVYPNPSHNSITISSACAMQMVEIYDIQGRLLFYEEFENKHFVQVKLLNFVEDNGIYISKIKVNNSTVTKRIILIKK